MAAALEPGKEQCEAGEGPEGLLFNRVGLAHRDVTITDFGSAQGDTVLGQEMFKAAVAHIRRSNRVPG